MAKLGLKHSEGWPLSEFPDTNRLMILEGGLEEVCLFWEGSFL